MTQPTTSSLPSSAETVTSEDYAIALIGRQISSLPTPAIGPIASTTARDSYDTVSKSPLAHRKPKRTANTEGTNRSKPKPRPAKASTTSSQPRPQERPPQRALEYQDSRHILNYSEPNDAELEILLIELIRNLTSPTSSTTAAPSELGAKDLQENFSWLITLLIGRLEPMGSLSNCRHQFALFIISLYRRNEQILAATTTVSAFQIHWNEKTITASLNLLIKTISTPYSPNDYSTHIDSLRALSLILFENSHLFAGLYHAILACLRPICDVRIVLDKEAQRVAFNCLGNMCYKSGNHGQAHYEEIWSLLTRQMAQLQPQVMTQAHLCRVFASVLRAIQFIIPEAKTIHEHGLPSLMATLHKFLFYGTPMGGTTLVNHLSGMASSSRSDSEPGNSAVSGTISSIGTGTGPTGGAGELEESLRVLDLGDDDDPHASGGTSYSGSDVYNDRHGLWKVRYHALGCLQAIARQSGSKFTQFWNLLLPQSTNQPSLVTIVLIDPVHQVRGASCRLLSAMFDGQHSFLDASQAKRPKPHSPAHPQTLHATSNLITALSDHPQDQTSTSTGGKNDSVITPTKARTKSPASTSFTPLSMKLTNMLREVHNGLFHALTTETRQTTLISIIKTIGVLAQETPYDALPPGTVFKIMTHLQKLGFDKALDPRIVKVSVSSLASFVVARVSSHEVLDLLEPTSSNLLVQMDHFLQTETTWSIKTEIFRFFSSVALQFPLLLVPHWKMLFSVVLTTITGESAQENDPNARHAAAKVVDDFSKALLHLSAAPQLPTLPDQSLNAFTKDLWRGILNSRLSELMVKDRFASVRGAICNLFSQIPAPVFATLTRKQQVMCITLLLGATKDEVPGVRSQAARALGIYILNQALKVDPLFVSDVALALVDAMKDKNLNVRTKAAWSAANLCDALVSVREASSDGSMSSDSVHPGSGHVSVAIETEEEELLPSPSDDVPRETLIVLAKTVLASCRDNDKVRCNAIRAVGNFMRFAKRSTFTADETSGVADEGKEEPVLVKQLIETLLHYTHEGSAKVRWNACYALANLFHNAYIVTTFQWATTRAIDALLAVLKTSSNFKVRINAATALQFAIAASSAVTISSELTDSILQGVVAPLLAEEGNRRQHDDPHGEAVQKDSSVDSHYTEPLREHLSRLVVSCLARMASEHSQPSTTATQALRAERAVFVREQKALLLHVVTPFSELTEAPTSHNHQEIPRDMDEDSAIGADEHTQLKPPSQKEMKASAKVALDFLLYVTS